MKIGPTNSTSVKFAGTVHIAVCTAISNLAFWHYSTIITIKMGAPILMVYTSYDVLLHNDYFGGRLQCDCSQFMG